MGDPEPLYSAVASTIHDSVIKSLEHEMERMQEFAEENVHNFYPDELNDEEIIWLSYRLPTPIALSILRYRMVRGLALRDRARQRSAASAAANSNSKETQA